MNQRGVTLIELLVAITLLGLVSLSLLFALRIGSSAWQRGSARLAVDRRVVAVHDLLTTQLGEVRPARVGWGPREKRVAFAYFDGAPDRLRFITSYSLERQGRGGLWLAEYALRDGELRYRELPFVDDEDAVPTILECHFEDARLVVSFAPPARESRVLLSGLGDGAFEYLIEPPQREAYWGRAWPVDGQWLPRSVALRFTAQEAGGIAPVAVVASLNVHEVKP
jgi:prepilin-type N-terminal cleavage/methylation domain-containing protein